MANCVNVNTQEFKALQTETGLSTKVLQSKVSLWQDVNGLENYPNKEQIFSFTPVSKRLGIYNKTVTLLQSNMIKKRVKAYNAKNNSSLYVVFENVGQDTYNWSIINSGEIVTKTKPELEVKEDSLEVETEDTEVGMDLEILNFFSESETELEELSKENADQFLKDQFSPEENAQIEKVQEGIDSLNTEIDLLNKAAAELTRVQKPGAILATTEFNGQVKVSFNSVEQAVNYFENKIQELQEKILEEGENIISNPSSSKSVVQPHYDAYLKQKEAMLIHVSNSLKNLYNQKNKFKSTKFDAKIAEFRVLKDNLESDIFDFNAPSADKLNTIKGFFKKDVETVKVLLSNPTIDNYFLAKDLLDFMQKVSDPTKEKSVGNTLTPYQGASTTYPPEVMEMLEDIRVQLDTAQMLVKDAGEKVLIELLSRHETKLNAIFNTSSIEEVREKLKEELNDITQVEKYLWSTGENLYTKNNVLDSLMRLEYEIEESKMISLQTQIKTAITAAERKGVAALKAIGKDYSLFQNVGKKRDTLVERYSSEYAEFLKALRTTLDSKIFSALKAKDRAGETALLDAKFNLLNDNTEFIDISKLHELTTPESDYSAYTTSSSAEATNYKAALIAKIGEIEYENLLETQRNHIDSYEQDLAAYTNFKLDEEGVFNEADLSDNSKRNIEIFKARTNPVAFSNNFFSNSTNAVAYTIGTQSNTATAKLKYNTFIPKRIDSLGNETGYFDSKYDQISSDNDVYTLYKAIRQGIYQNEENLRGSGVYMKSGDIPTFKQTLADVVLEKGWKGTLKQGLPTTMPETLTFLKNTVTLKPVRTFLAKNLSGKSVEFGPGNEIEAPSEISFSNEGENKLDLATVVKISLELSTMHKARALAKDKVRVYMEESDNLTDSKGNIRQRERDRQKFFYNQVLLNRGGKKQYGDISKALISLDKALRKKPFSKSRMFYKYFTPEQKKVFTEALTQWRALEKKGFSTLTKKEEDQRVALEETMTLMGQDYFLSTVYRAVFMKVAISLNLALNIPAQIINKMAGLTAAINRDGRYWPEGSVYACASFLHKKDMMKLVDKDWKETSNILNHFVERTGLINDGSSELERSEGRLRKKVSVLYPMGLMKWAEDSNQTLGILCRATGLTIKDINGNEFPLFDGKKFNGYEMKDGMLSLQPEFDTPENREAFLDMSSENFIDWKQETKTTLEELNGDYSHTGVTMIKGNVLTAPLMLYKTWLPKYIGSRWRANQRNVSLGKEEKGFMLEAIKGETSGSSGFLLGGTAALGALTAGVTGWPIVLGTGLAVTGIGRSIYKSYKRNQRIVPDTDEVVVSWQKQVNFVLQTLLRTPATPINMLAGKQIIKGSEAALGLDSSKLNEQASLLAARDVARNLQYSMTLMALHFAIQAAFGPPDEEKEKKGKVGSVQRQRYLEQKRRQREEHPYFNYATNTLLRLFQETNTALDPTILFTTFGSKNTLEGAFDKMGKFLIAWYKPEEEDTFKTGPHAGLSKTNIAARKAFLPATLRFLGANSWEDPFDGWKAGFESPTEEEWNKEGFIYENFRTTDFKKESKMYKAEVAKNTPKAKKLLLAEIGYPSEKDIPVEQLDLFAKRVKEKANELVIEDNIVQKPVRRDFDTVQKRLAEK